MINICYFQSVNVAVMCVALIDQKTFANHWTHHLLEEALVPLKPPVSLFPIPSYPLSPAGGHHYPEFLSLHCFKNSFFILTHIMVAYTNFVVFAGF